MNPLDNLFGNPVQRIDAIILEMFKKEMAIIEAEGGMENEIRKQKACKIEDCFRGLKLAQVYEPKAREFMANPVKTFDRLYDMDLHTLEAYSYALDKCNTAYMREKVEEHNRADWNKKDSDFWR